MIFNFRKPKSGGGGSGGGSIEGVTLAQTTGNGTDVIMSQKAVSDRIQYTNSTPVPTAIGGVKAGTTFNKTPINDILDSLLYPYQNPSFGSFSVDGQSSGSFELGHTYPSGNKLFTWNIINPNNIKENSITLNAESGLPNTGSKSQMVPNITKNAVGSHTFTIKAQNSNNVEFSRTITFNWLAKRFWGVSEEESVTDDIIKSFSNELSSSRVKTVSYDGTGGKYPYFIYPTALGDLNNTKVNNLEWNDWVLVKRDFINVNGVSIPMNIYRGFNKINGALTINWGNKMAALQGTILASKIVPTDSLDDYATHEDKYGRGGHRSVDTLEERDSITTPRRKEGMTVYVKENKTKYILESGIENANWKVDINTVYAEPMSTNYTTRNEALESGKTVKYPLNGISNNYALHAFALKELPVGSEVFLLNTALMDSGYYGVKIPRINNIQLSLTSSTTEPFKRMTTHSQHGQTVSATTEYNSDYVAWKIFSIGDAPTAFNDCWASSGAPTPSDPQIITFTSPNTFLMSRYKVRSRNTYIASIKTWKIEGRVGNSGNWELIHEVVNDTRNDPLLDRVFDIPKENRKACNQHRLVIFDRNGTEPYTVLSRLIIYQEPAKFMIEDGVNKYRSTSSGFSLSYTPMTKYSEHNQVVSATSEYDATYVSWKVLLAGDPASNSTDCWASIAAPTALAPQIITIDLGQPKKIYSYTIVNRFDSANSIGVIASPSSWSIEVRNNLLDDWIVIDNVQGDKDSNSLSVRKFSIAEENRGEWRYFRIVIKDRNSTAPYTCISRLRIYGDLIGEELEPVPNVTTKNDITVNGTSSEVFITKQKLSTLSNPYIITDEPSAVKLTIDSEKEYEYSNSVKIALANTYIKFTATESGKYKFCYQEPAPVI